MNRENVVKTETVIEDFTIGDRPGRVVVEIWTLMFLLTGVKAGEGREMIGGVRDEMIDTVKRDGLLQTSEEEGEKSLGIGMRREQRGEITGSLLGVGVLIERGTEIAREGIAIGILTGGEEMDLSWEELNIHLVFLISKRCLYDGFEVRFRAS